MLAKRRVQHLGYRFVYEASSTIHRDAACSHTCKALERSGPGVHGLLQACAWHMASAARRTDKSAQPARGILALFCQALTAGAAQARTWTEPVQRTEGCTVQRLQMPCTCAESLAGRNHVSRLQASTNA